MASMISRPTLIPRWLVPALVVTLVVTAGGAAVILFAAPPASVSVPSVTGLDASVARSRLAQQGLFMEYRDTRFSSRFAPGTVIEQDPPPGTSVEQGMVVTIVVSAGSETFEMPDLIGLTAVQARMELESRGVVVEIEEALSDAARDTVIASMPAPGAEVGTGSVVRLTVAGDVAADLLLPGDLGGTIVLLDPAPSPAGTADMSMEVTRRLRSLLEASGAEVMVTRSILETSSPVHVRAAWVRGTFPSVTIGLEMGTIGGGERSVRSLPAYPENVDVYLPSVDFARAAVSYLTDAGESASLVLPEDDLVLAAAGSQGIRVFLGDPEDPVNVDAFADPAWVDRIAQALYRALVATLPAPENG